MSSKGISAMIATVMLIAFTVAVGGILSLWLTTLTSTQTTTVGSSAEKQILCSRSVLTITEVTSNFQTSPSNDTFNVTVVYTYGTEDVYYFNLTFIDNLRNSITVTPNISAGKNFNKTNPFQPGMMKVFSMNINSSSDLEPHGQSSPNYDLAGTSLSSVRIRAICQDNYPLTTECKSGQSCMK